jgi:hypothetical protein
VRLRLKIAALAAIVVVAPFISFGGNPGSDSSFNPNLFVTPALKYSVIGKGLGLMFQPQLYSMAMRIHQEMKSNRFELMDINHSPMASIGLFADPSETSPTVRYLGVTARVNIKLNVFPDTDSGRLSSAMDAFGKDLLVILGDTLTNVQDVGIRGVVLVLIYSKLDLSDPNYYNDAEAVAIFIPRDTLKEFNAFRIRFNQLFDMSEMFMFKGNDQIQTLLNEFLQG